MHARGYGWALALVLVVAACGPSGARVQNPASLAAASSLEATEQAILDALPQRNWTPEEVAPGRIVASLAMRTHLLRAEIRYDAQRVSVLYLDSDHLDETREQSGEVYAHKNVNVWLSSLAQDLAATLGSSAQGSRLTSGSSR